MEHKVTEDKIIDDLIGTLKQIAAMLRDNLVYHDIKPALKSNLIDIMEMAERAYDI